MGLETLNLSVSDSIFRTNSFIRNVAPMVASYTQVISRIGGYNEATFVINDNQIETEDWFTNGVGRHVEIYSSFQVKIWEGFVDSVDIVIGNLSGSSGKLTNVINRTNLAYSTFIANVNGGNAVGVRIETPVGDETTSQALYGIRHQTVQAGGITAANAVTERDNALAKFRFPETSLELAAQASIEAVTINCKGYYHLLDYPFTSPTTGSQNLSDKLIDILEAEPNGFINTNLNNIEINTTQVDAQDTDGDKALDIIQGLLNLGDVSGNSYEFGLYDDRTARYRAVPLTLEYQQKLRDPQAGRITNLVGAEIYPWEVRPAKLLLIADFLIGQTEPLNILQDTRVIFIESVGFTAPWSVVPKGGSLSTIRQALNKAGLGGIEL